MNALANAEVGDYLNRHFVSSFQKVGTFRVVNGQKQGGNVASYFCTPDGGILDAIAGPVDAATLLREARWVVDTRKTALLESHGNVVGYKEFFRIAHAQRLPPVPAVVSVDWARLPFYAPTPESMAAFLQRAQLARSLDKQGRIHLLLALYPLVKLDQAYQVVYHDIVGEDVSTQPVAVGAAAPVRSPVQASGGCVSGGTAAVRAPVQSPWLAAGAPRGFYFSPLLNRPVPSSAEDLHERARAAALAHARDDPAATEVRSGRALNVVLDDLLKRQGEEGAGGVATPLGADVLAHINVRTAGAGAADFGLLRDGGKLRWPLPWQDAPLDEPSRALRQSVASAIGEALAQGKTGRPSDTVLEQLRRDLRSLHGVLARNVRAVTPSEYITAREYLKQLDAALAVLRGNDATRYITGQLALDPAKIHTVPDLVTFMGAHGLKFAAAVAGDESAYAALQQALAASDRSQAPDLSAVDRGAL